MTSRLCNSLEICARIASVRPVSALKSATILLQFATMRFEHFNPIGINGPHFVLASGAESHDLRDFSAR
jgi:hypothetical protein